MEGMILRECLSIQQSFLTICGSKLSILRWGKGLTMKLLEVTHNQWLYRNVNVHDSVSGDISSQQKEEIQHEIGKKQQELGRESLTMEDHYLMKVNLDDMETTSGERQEHWLLTIRATREAFRLRTITDCIVIDGITQRQMFILVPINANTANQQGLLAFNNHYYPGGISWKDDYPSMWFRL